MAIPAISPLGGISSPFGSDTGRSSFTSVVAANKKKKQQATELQRLQLALAATMQDENKSFVETLKDAPGNLLSNTKSAVFGTLDILSRPGQFTVGLLLGGEESRRAGGGAIAQLKAGWAQGVKGFKGEEVNLFGNYLLKRGVLVHHSTTRAVVGFGGDVALDPLTYVGGIGVATKIGRIGGTGARRIKNGDEIRGAADNGLDDLADPDTAAKYLHESALDAADFSTGRVEAMKAAFRKGGESQHAGGYSSQSFLALEGAEDAIRITGAKNIDDAKHALGTQRGAAGQQQLEVLEEMTDAAFTGYQKTVAKAAQMSIALPFASKNVNFGRAVRDGRIILNPTHIGGRRVAPLMPSLDRVASGNGILAGFPAVGALSRRLAESSGSIVPGLGRRADHALEMAAKHTTELHQKRITEFINGRFKGVAAAINKKQKDEAVDYYGQQGAVKGVEEADTILLDEAHLRKGVESGKIVEEQAEFIRAWHDVVEELRKGDELWGVKFDWSTSDSVRKVVTKKVGVAADGTPVTRSVITGGRGYIPHVYTPSGRQLATIQDRLVSGDVWWSKPKNFKSTPAEIKKAAEAGQLGKVSLANIETDSMRILAIRARSSAAKRVNRNLERHLADKVGIPVRMPDPARVAAVSREAAELTGKQERLVGQLTDEHRERELRNLMRNKEQDLVDEIAAEGANTANKLKKNKIEHGSKPNAAASRASISRGSAARLEKLNRRLDQVRARDFEGQDLKRAIADMNKREAKRFRQFNRNERRLTQIKNKDLPDALNAKPNKGFDEGYVELGGLKNQTGQRVAIPKELASSWRRYSAVFDNTEEVVGGFAQFYNKQMSRWKVLVTAVNLGYRFRNTMTDMWNAYIAGMPLRQMPVHGAGAMKDMMQAWMHVQKNLGETSSKRYRTMENFGLKPSAESAALIDEAFRLGVSSGLFGGDVATQARKYELASSAKARFKKGRVGSAYAEAMLTFNRNAENWGRLMHYRYRRLTLGESPSEAARTVRIAHFDYEDLTDFERNVGKKIFPFYTWTRKNIPYQIRQVFQYPGRVNTFPKAAREFTAAAEQDDEKDFTGIAGAPEWVNERFGFRIPGGAPGVARFVAPQLGIQDLSKLDDPGGAFAEMLTPAIKIPLEAKLNRSLLTGAPIQGTHPRNPVKLDFMGVNAAPFVQKAGAAASKILPFLPDPDIGQTQRLVGDEQVSGLGINPYWSWLFGQAPPTNFFFNTRAEIKQKQARMDHAGIISYVGGIKFIDVEQETEALIRRINFQEEASRHIRGLRDEDTLEEVERQDLSDYNRRLQEILLGGDKDATE